MSHSLTSQIYLHTVELEERLSELEAEIISLRTKRKVLKNKLNKIYRKNNYKFTINGWKPKPEIGENSKESKNEGENE